MSSLWQALMLVRRSDKPSFWRRVLYVLLQSLLPLANLCLLKLLVDSVAAGVSGTQSPVAFLPVLLAMVGVFLLNRIVAALDGVNGDYLSQRLIDYMSDIMQRQAARLDLSYYDTPSYHDTFHRAQQEAGLRPIQILNNFMAVGGALVSIVGVTAMLLSASWWIVPVMVVAVLPSFIVRLHKARSIYSFRRSNTQTYRRTSYYNHLLTSREAAKEMRVFRLAPHFRRLFVESRSQLVGRLLRISRRLGMADILCAVVEATAMLAIVYLLARQAFGGAITVGTFVMLFEAFRRGQGYLSSLVAGVAGLYDNRLFVNNLFEFLRLEPTILSPDEPLPLPKTIETVEFRDITFRYPDMQRDVLCHYNLTARVGEVTRIEGENGYGKSTLVKLLLRLYDPQQGSVLLNGIDIRRFRLDELRRIMGVLFQDFVRYNCTAAENISFGDTAPHSVEDAARQAGADKVIDCLPHGIDTQLGRVFDGGQELSMGQWQRLALARALQSDAPLLLLDEPVAWIDVNARERFFATLEQLKQHKIILLINHA
jgi:ATP-binding cassette subfamily B protein